MQPHQLVQEADIVLILGSRDDRVADYAVSLIQQGVASRGLVSGGNAQGNDLLAKAWSEGTEAEHFANIMKAHGINEEFLLIEDRATNTDKNVHHSHELLKRMGISVQKY